MRSRLRAGTVPVATLRAVGLVLLLAALAVIGFAFNKLVMARPRIDRWTNERLIAQRERMIGTTALHRIVWPRSEVLYVRWNRAILSVVLGAFTAAALGTVIALVWRALGME